MKRYNISIVDCENAYTYSLTIKNSYTDYFYVRKVFVFTYDSIYK